MKEVGINSYGMEKEKGVKFSVDKSTKNSHFSPADVS
jgi:hypothetical protein